jgi:hypothetical protein
VVGHGHYHDHDHGDDHDHLSSAGEMRGVALERSAHMTAGVRTSAGAKKGLGGWSECFC